MARATRHLPPATHARAKLSPASPSSSSCRIPRASGLPSAAYLCARETGPVSPAGLNVACHWPEAGRGLTAAGGCLARDLALAGRSGRADRLQPVARLCNVAAARSGQVDHVAAVEDADACGRRRRRREGDEAHVRPPHKRRARKDKLANGRKKRTDRKNRRVVSISSKQLGI